MTATVFAPETEPQQDTETDQLARVRAAWSPLTALDRCEAPVLAMTGETRTTTTCGAQAFVRAVFPTTGHDLLFCGHCIGEQTVGKRAETPTARKLAARRAALVASGAVLLSDYDSINAKPDASANA